MNDSTTLHPAWVRVLNGDPLPWLLAEDNPAVRHLALRRLLDRKYDDPDVRVALAGAMRVDPIAAILAAQQPGGYWVKPGAGYTPKYRSTVWQVIFLDQLGADGEDERVRAGCEYVLSHTQSETGGFSATGAKSEAPPPPAYAVHCLHGNLLRALIGFGWIDDARVRRAIDWQARAITGEGFSKYYRSGTSGPLFRCAYNEDFSCCWGAVKALLALARVPTEEREPHVRRAIEKGVDFLLSRDPALADYPMGWGNDSPNRSWFHLGFPLGYVADVLQTLEALCELGYARDRRLRPAVEWLLSKQDAQGRWRNQRAYTDKTWVMFEQQGAASKWVTLRACRVIKAVYDK
jgi:hypothetical protein